MPKMVFCPAFLVNAPGFSEPSPPTRMRGTLKHGLKIGPVLQLHHTPHHG